MAVRDVDAIEALFPVTLLAIVFVAVCGLIVSDIIDHRYNLEKEAINNPSPKGRGLCSPKDCVSFYLIR